MDHQVSLLVLWKKIYMYIYRIDHIGFDHMMSSSLLEEKREVKRSEVGEVGE